MDGISIPPTAPHEQMYLISETIRVSAIRSSVGFSRFPFPPTLYSVVVEVGNTDRSAYYYITVGLPPPYNGGRTPFGIYVPPTAPHEQM